MELCEIAEIQETSRQREANELLDSGWVLLSTGFHRGDVPGYDYHSYSLGRPKGVKPIVPKDFPDGLNF